MDEKEAEKLKNETKKLLDKFSKSLSAVKSEAESNVERDSDRRKEHDGKTCNNDFREIFFENSPQHDDKFIIAEKKTW